MVRLKGLLFVGAFAFALSAMGCSDDSGTPTPDGSITKKDTGPKAQIDCTTNACNTYVFSRILLPATATEAAEYGYDYDNNSIKDNALGSILSGLAGAMGSGFEMQPAIDNAVYQGTALLLLQVQAKDITADPNAALQAYIGAKQACCAGQENDPAACKTAAEAGCFSGSGVFAVAPTSPTDAILGGAITGGEMAFGPASLKIEIPFGSTALSLNLVQARIKGTIDANGITKGVLSGAIPKTDLDNSVIPGVAKLVQGIVDDPTTKPDTKTQVLSLFDTDKDGKISEEEVKTNSLIANFLGGDVDVDGDKVPELSLGIGFTAVKASIGTPSTPDAGVTPDSAAADAGAQDAAAGE